MKTSKKVLLFIFSLLLIYCVCSIGYSTWIITTEKHFTPSYSGQAEITIDNFDKQETTYDGKTLIDDFNYSDTKKIDVKLPESLKEEVNTYYEKDYIYRKVKSARGEECNEIISGTPRDAGTYEVTIKAKENSDHEDIIITLTVNPIIIDLGYGYKDNENNITPTSSNVITKVYNGEFYTPAVYVNNLQSNDKGVEDTCELTYEWKDSNDANKNSKIRNHTENAYQGTVTSCSNENYILPEDVNFTFQIKQLEIIIIWTDLSFVYNNVNYIPTAEVSNLVAGDHATIELTSDSNKKNANAIYNSTIDDFTLIAGKDKYIATVDKITGEDSINYKLGTDKTHEFIITQKGITITANDKTIIYGYAANNRGYTLGNEFANNESASNLNDLQVSYSYTYDTSIVASRKVGNYEIKLDATTSNTNYSMIPQIGTLTVNPKEVAISWSDTTFTYDGMSHIPTAQVNNKAYSEDTVFVSVDNSYAKTNSHMKDNSGNSYEVKIKNELGNNTNGNYSLTYDSNAGVSSTFKINQKDINDITQFEITDTQENLVYKAQQITPTFVVKDIVNDTSIINNNDYTISFGENILVSTGGSITITGKGNYTGTKQISFAIAKKDLVITANNCEIIYKDPLNNKGVNYSGFVGEENENNLNGTLVIVSDYSQGDDVGKYNLTPTELTSSNYDITFVDGILTVQPKDISFTMTSRTFDYDGTSKSIIVNEEVPNGVNIIYTNNIKINAGKYNVKADISSNDNYNIITKTINAEMIINKINYIGDISIPVGLSGNDGDLLSSVDITAIDNKFTWVDNNVVLSSSVTTYKANYVHSENYLPKVVDVPIQVNSDITIIIIVTFTGNTDIIYDGNIHKLNIKFTNSNGQEIMPSEISGLNVLMGYGNDIPDGFKNVNNNSQDPTSNKVYASVEANSNYEFVAGDGVTIDSKGQFVTELNIKPKKLTIKEWNKGEYIYNGEQQAPTVTFNGIISDDECSADVEGAIDAGDHTATIIGLIGDQSNNYIVDNETVEFTINKATLIIEKENYPTVKDEYVYENREPNLTGGEIKGINNTVIYDSLIGGGVFTVDINTIQFSTGANETSEDKISVTFTPTSNNYKPIPFEIDVTVRAVAKDSTTYYGSIEKALSSVAIGDIFVIPGTNPIISHDCTIKTGINLVIPYEGETFENRQGTGKDFADNTIDNVKKNLKNEILINSNITLNIETNGKMIIGAIVGNTSIGLAAATSGFYTQITMEENSKIISSGNIICYGYIKESSLDNGSQVVLNSGELSIPFVIHDYRGGSSTAAVYKSENGHISPFSVYEMPNVQTKLEVHSNATVYGLVDLYTGELSISKLGCTATINARHNTDKVKIISTNSALFNLGSTGYLIMKYTPKIVDEYMLTVSDGVNGRTNVKLYNKCSLGSLSININAAADVTYKPKGLRLLLQPTVEKLLNTTITTADVFFPMNWKYDYELYNGEFAVDSKAKFMTGTSVYVDKTATLNINKDTIFYNNFTDVESGGCRYPDKSAAKLIVNGSLNINAGFGGTILTTSNKDAKIKITTNNLTLTSLEGYGKMSGLSFKFIRTNKITSSVKGYIYGTSQLSSLDQKIYYSKDSHWYANKCSIYYDANGGVLTGEDSEGLYDVNKENGYIINKIYTSNPTRKFYEFAGWFMDQECTIPVEDGQTAIYGSTYIYAGWRPIDYNITYEWIYMNCDKVKDSNSITNNNPVTFNKEFGFILTDPTITSEYGYVFGGWYTDSTLEKENKINVVDSRLYNDAFTIYGAWYPKNTETHTVQYVVNNDDVENIPNSNIVNDKAELYKPPINYENYNNNLKYPKYFLGWYTDAQFTNKFTESTALTGDVTLYAKWESKIKIRLNYQKAGQNYSYNNYYIPGKVSLPTLKDTNGTVDLETMIWFTNSSHSSSTYYIGGEEYSINNNIDNLYGEYYYIVKAKDNDNSDVTNGAFNKKNHFNIMISSKYVDISKFTLTMSNPKINTSESWGTVTIKDYDPITKSGGFYNKDIIKLILDGVQIQDGLFKSDKESIGRPLGKKDNYVYHYIGMFDENMIKQVILTNRPKLGLYAFSNNALFNHENIIGDDGNLYNHQKYYPEDVPIATEDANHY